MTVLSAPMFPEMPFFMHWNADEIAAAVPRRLSELSMFDPDDALPCANCDASPASRRSHSYLPPTQPALFRVRG